MGVLVCAGQAWAQAYDAAAPEVKQATLSAPALSLAGPLGFAPAKPPQLIKSGAVDSSLSQSLSQAGVPDEVALTMVRELSQAFNVEQDVRKGDTFHVLFQAQARAAMQAWQNPRAVGITPLIPGTAKLLGFQFTSLGKRYEAYLYEDAVDVGLPEGYYFTDGLRLKPAFLRTPIELVRVSSGFGGRIHPIKRDWRTHEGIDFAAPTGTRVFAAGDGEVAFVGTQNGFGQVVKLTHMNDTNTVYAHLSKFADTLRVGQRVKQGDVIGYVGQTGWATGPHLHYEYRVNNKPLDPFKTHIPSVARVPDEHMAAFQTRVNALRGTLQAGITPVQGASNTALAGNVDALAYSVSE